MVAQTRLDGDDRSVSPVIGIVLIVAITVVLVGVTAVYLTSFGDENKQPAPRFSPETDFNDTYGGNGQYLNITHHSGDPIDTSSITFKVKDARVRSGGSTSPAEYTGNVIENQAGSEFVATDTLSLNRTAFVDSSGNPLTGSAYLDLTEATVLIVWENEDGSRTEIIYECEVQEPGCA